MWKTPTTRARIRQGFGEGLHRYHGYRSRFADSREEILLLGNGPSGSSAAASIYVWRPGVGEVEVLPQKWFTGEAFDLGYQWIT